MMLYRLILSSMVAGVAAGMIAIDAAFPSTAVDVLCCAPGAITIWLLTSHLCLEPGMWWPSMKPAQTANEDQSASGQQGDRP